MLSPYVIIKVCLPGSAIDTRKACYVGVLSHVEVAVISCSQITPLEHNLVPEGMRQLMKPIQRLQKVFNLKHMM